MENILPPAHAPLDAKPPATQPSPERVLREINEDHVIRGIIERWEQSEARRVQEILALIKRENKALAQLRTLLGAYKSKVTMKKHRIDVLKMRAKRRGVPPKLKSKIAERKRFIKARVQRHWLREQRMHFINETRGVLQ